MDFTTPSCLIEIPKEKERKKKSICNLRRGKAYLPSSCWSGVGRSHLADSFPPDPREGCYLPLKSAPRSANSLLKMPRSVLGAQGINCWAARNRLIEVLKAESAFELRCVLPSILGICRIKQEPVEARGSRQKEALFKIPADGGTHFNSLKHTTGCYGHFQKEPSIE